MQQISLMELMGFFREFVSLFLGGLASSKRWTLFLHSNCRLVLLASQHSDWKDNAWRPWGVLDWCFDHFFVAFDLFDEHGVSPFFFASL